MLYDTRRSELTLFSAHTLEALSKDKLLDRDFSHLSLLLVVVNLGRGARNQGYSWSSSKNALSMCRSSVVGGAYDTSMMSRDAQGFFCDYCGIWAVSKISQDTGLTSSWICESCEKAAGSLAFVDPGQADYLCSEIPDANGDATVLEQLVQYDIPAMDQSALFETDMTSYFPIFEGQSADISYSNAAYDPDDFVFPYDLFASTNSLVLPEQTVPQSSPSMAMSCHAGQGLKRISDTAIQRYRKERAVCSVPGCGATCSRESDIPRHIATTHGSKERHFCGFPGCTKYFPRKDKATSHRRMHGLGGQAGST